MKKISWLVAVAFVGLAALDAQAVRDQGWDRAVGRATAAFRQSGPAPTPVKRNDPKRIAKRVRIQDGFVFTGSSGTSISTEAFSLLSPATPNEANNATLSNLLLENADDPELPMETVNIVTGLENSLRNMLATQGAGKGPTFEFAGINITRLKVKGAYRGVSNFRRLVGSEKYTVSGVIVGGPDDGLPVVGTLKIKVAAQRALSQ